MNTVGAIDRPVRDTESTGTYGTGFDYKWLDGRGDDGADRMHAIPMLYDAMFHWFHVHHENRARRRARHGGLPSADRWRARCDGHCDRCGDRCPAVIDAALKIPQQRVISRSEWRQVWQAGW